MSKPPMPDNRRVKDGVGELCNNSIRFSFPRTFWEMTAHCERRTDHKPPCRVVRRQSPRFDLKWEPKEASAPDSRTKPRAPLEALFDLAERSLALVIIAKTDAAGDLTGSFELGDAVDIGRFRQIIEGDRFELADRLPELVPADPFDTEGEVF